MSGSHPRLLVSSGEPAGIGPDLCLLIAHDEVPASLVIVADPELLRERAAQLQVDVRIHPVNPDELAKTPLHEPGTLAVLPIALHNPCHPGSLAVGNSAYVIEMLTTCVTACQQRQVHGMVTAPVHKGIINEAGIKFSGHTELLAELTGTSLAVMLLCAGELRVALATTHLPLAQVPAALSRSGLQDTIRILRDGLSAVFGITDPRVAVCGLNPHAGENGHLGREEIDLIEPALAQLRASHNWQLSGPLPADTIFTPKQLENCDAVLAMYHDQGLPVLKYAGFGNAVNVTLGLPIIRTSVDHGTALDLAGTGQIDVGSMRAAINLATNAVSVR